jgi:hypothetical protein
VSYKSPDSYHRHKCKYCALVWEHHDVNDARHGDEGAHECPGCHRCNWSLGIYEGDQAPVVRNGKMLPPGMGSPTKIHPDQMKTTKGEADG